MNRYQPGYQPGHQPGYQPDYQPGYHPAHHHHPQEKFMPIVQQPQQTQSSNVVVNMGGAQPGRRRDWSTGFCGCCEDVATCCCVMACPLFQLCSLSTRLEEIVCLPCVVPMALMALRIKLRESNDIAGSIFVDCVTTTCCPMLALCQMIRELDNIDRKKPGTQM